MSVSKDSKAASTLSHAQLQQRFCPPPPHLLLLFILTYTSLDLQHSGSSITCSAFCRNASKTHRCLERGCALGNRRTGPCGHCLCGESLGLTIFRAWTCYCATPPPFPGQQQHHHQPRRHPWKLSPTPVAAVPATEGAAVGSSLVHHPSGCPPGRRRRCWAPFKGMRRLLQRGAGAGGRGSCPRRRGALKRRKR